jgi:glycosyltransferase involved in cell wall biosynthesis
MTTPETRNPSAETAHQPVDDPSPRRIRVMYFLNTTDRGGVEHHVLDLLRCVDRRRFDLLLVCPPVLAAKLRADVEAIGVPLDEVDVRRPWHLAGMWRLWRLIRRWRPDVVHSHLYSSGRFGNPIAWVSGVPLVLETGHLEEAWRSGWQNWLALADGMICRFTHRIIAVSHAVKRFYVTAKRVPERKVVVIHNGIDLDRFAPDAPRDIAALRQELGLGPKDRVACVVGRLAEQKGHCYLLEAAKTIFAAVPEARLVVAGQGPLEQPLKALAAELGVAERVVFAGFRSDADNIYALSDVAVLPSLFEGLPLTVAEAQAMRKPVVATRVSGTPEVLIDGETGVLVPPRDAPALAEAVIRLLNDPVLARRMGERGREHVCAHFSLKLQIEETENVYEQALTP